MTNIIVACAFLLGAMQQAAAGRLFVAVTFFVAATICLSLDLVDKERQLPGLCAQLAEKEAEARRLREERDHYREKALGLPASKGDSDG